MNLMKFWINKLLFLFLASALISSCQPNYTYSSHKITVTGSPSLATFTSEEKEYELLGVRGDSAIVVLDWQEQAVKPIPFSHAKLLKTDSILLVTREGKGTRPPTLAGIAIGAGVGFLFAVIAGNQEFGGPGAAGTRAGFGIIGASTLLGAGISTLFPPDKKMFLNSKTDWQFLKSIAAYPDHEPEEMNYIK